VKKFDRFYTPPRLAEALVGYIASIRSPTVIADFAAGDGELLRAAQQKWPQAQLVATDLNCHIVSRLRAAHQRWRIGKADFLNPSSRERCQALSEIKGKVTLAILNPPFSCRGAKSWSITINGATIKCGLAMAFICTTVSYLASGSHILAVLPAGCLRSQKDQAAWEAVDAVCERHIIARNGHRAFKGCFPRTVLVHLRLRPEGTIGHRQGRVSKHLDHNDNAVAVHIVRGTVPMHSLNGESSRGMLPLVHSTDLLNGGVMLSRRKGDRTRRGITGPAVLIPRVGQPSKCKVCLYSGKGQVVLSDCVIGLKCKTLSDAKDLRHALLRRWQLVKEVYGGTCARYITLEGLRGLLSRLGFHASTPST